MSTLTFEQNTQIILFTKKLYYAYEKKGMIDRQAFANHVYPNSFIQEEIKEAVEAKAREMGIDWHGIKYGLGEPMAKGYGDFLENK